LRPHYSSTQIRITQSTLFYGIIDLYSRYHQDQEVPMELNLNGKIAVITGASRGIGRAVARELSAQGMRLVLAARSRDLLEDLAASLPVDCLVHEADLRIPQAPAALIAAAVERFGCLDLLVNNAGATKRGDFLSFSDDDWNDGFALKFFGAMRCSREAWRWLVQSSGAIINVVGIGGRTGSAEFSIGGSVNAALLNLTKSLADRGVRDGVRVNAINPGSIATERLQTRIRSYAAEHNMDEVHAAMDMAKSMGISRFGTPEEIARSVAFLASPQNAYIQGAVLDIDGGQTRTL
jgi:NAD(P)-dependent dehydrogenase (short-subunit alcohol dehydrogenase family)